MIVPEIIRENAPFIAIGVAGGAAWAVVTFAATRRIGGAYHPDPPLSLPAAPPPPPPSTPPRS